MRIQPMHTTESFLLRYTDDAENVIGRLEDEITPEYAKHDKQANTNKNIIIFRTSFDRF